MSIDSSWSRFSSWYFESEELGFGFDLSKMAFHDNLIVEMAGRIEKAFSDMSVLESGGIANPDENRMVGHYWLRSAELAPSAQIRAEIEVTLNSIKDFAATVRRAQICNEAGESFKHLLLIGIGGSALGPQFLNQALSSTNDPLDIYFFDNTDPDGFAATLAKIPNLKRTLCLVISKSGGTKETRNGQLIAKGALEKLGLDYRRHFIAITCKDSALDQQAAAENWVARFPMWDWVGGRTSVLSAVGLLPAALQGFDIDALLVGAAAMDQLTRARAVKNNPAMLMALMWYHAGLGRGVKDMVVLPYRDRLELFSRYLQQLVMESLGKDRDLSGNLVHQGLTVYGNKGSTDQHAFVQQLRDGRNSFFVVFVEVLRDLSLESTDKSGSTKWISEYQVEPGIRSADYLAGFFLGTRQALAEAGRESITITIRELNAHSIGMLIALFERAVGFYASFIGVNAYHQPGVEAGKKAAAEVIKLQQALFAALQECQAPLAFNELLRRVAAEDRSETAFKILKRLEAQGSITSSVSGSDRFDALYSLCR